MSEVNVTETSTGAARAMPGTRGAHGGRVPGSARGGLTLAAGLALAGGALLGSPGAAAPASSARALDAAEHASRSGAAERAAQAPAYTLVATRTLPLRALSSNLPPPASAGLCPLGRVATAVTVAGFVDTDRLALVTRCSQMTSTPYLVVVAPGDAIYSAAPLGGERPLNIGFDPYTRRVLRSAVGSASRPIVHAEPVADSAYAARTWSVVPANSDALPQDFATGLGGIVHGLSIAGVARFGPGNERRPPWVPVLPSGDWAVPGSLAVDGEGFVYVQTRGEAPAKFSADGRPVEGWSIAGLAAPAGLVAGHAEGNHLALLERAPDGTLGVRAFAPDGRTLAIHPLPSELVPSPLPDLAVGPGGQYALSGRLASGPLAVTWHAADGTLRRAIASYTAVAPPSHGSPSAYDQQVLHVAGSADAFAGQAPFPGDVVRWDAEGAVAADQATPSGTLDVALLDDGDVLLRVGSADPASAYSSLQRRAPDGTVRWTAQLSTAGPGLAIGGDRAYAALPGEAGVAVVALDDGRALGRLDLTTGSASWTDDLAPVAGGGVAAIDGPGGRIDVWDPRAPLRPARQLAIPAAQGAARLAIGPDGRAAVLASWDGASGTTVRVFDDRGTVLWDLTFATLLGSFWPHDIAYDGAGRLAVIGHSSREPERGVVLVFEPAGPPLPPPATATAAPTPAMANAGPCRVDGDKTAAPHEIWLGETVTVTLTLTRTCPDIPQPADIVLIVDVSGSMNGEKERAAAEAVQAFVDGIDLAEHRVGKVRFNQAAAMIHGLSADPAVVRNIPRSYGADGGTSIAAGLTVADEHLRDAGRSGVRHVMVLISDGGSDVESAVLAGRRARARGAIVFTVGIGEGVNADLLLRVATSWQHAYLTLRPDNLPAIYREIASLVASGAGPGVVDDTLDPDVALVPGTFNVPPLTALGAGLRWGLPADFGRPVTLTYQVRPLRTGIVPTNTEAFLDYVDLDGQVRRFVYPVPEVLVRAPTSTPTTVPPATPTPTPTPTRVPEPIYLPIALRELPCAPAQRRADIALVIDASTSMLEPAAGGRTKLDAALDAVAAFLGGLDLQAAAPGGGPAAGDRAAIVAFNREAVLLSPLSGDRAALGEALARVTVAPHTCIVCGMEAAVQALGGARRTASVSRVIVLLTDGRSNPRPVAEAEAVAEAAKADGVVVFTIGLGADLDADALVRMASRPAFAFRAPTADDLAAIYAAVAGAIPCPADTWWGGR